MKNELIIKQFEGSEVEFITNDDGEVMFELYSTGSALGYNRTVTSKGKEYFQIRKDRIDNIMKNGAISGFPHDGEIYLSVDELRKFISMSNTKNKHRFIEWLKKNKLIEQKEIFEYKRKEELFMDSLKMILKQMKLTLETQVIDHLYRFDGYIKELDMIIEYDENGHAYYNEDDEYTRELYIKNTYSHLVRVTDFDDLMTNIGKVMHRISEVI